ncbi:MAG: hypothetical protein HC929_07005 [Leptolyngbyaceae cyanobacterium SM2_5_2]|nr:hypothetical protein [Leptolyngbyaceae cyanobacterium SM2_5_2]
MTIPTPVNSFSEPQALSVSALLRPISWQDEAVDFSELIAPSLGQANLLGGSSSSMVLAQQFDQDILGDIVAAWNVFLESGQIWALLIGIVIGYMIRNLTAY